MCGQLAVATWPAAPRSEAGVSGKEISGFDELPEKAADLWLISSFPHLVPSVGCVKRSRLPDSLSHITDTGRWYALAASRGDGGWSPVGSWAWGRS